MIPYNIRNWYWFVGGDETRPWSSAAGKSVFAYGYIFTSDQAFQAWLAAGGMPTRIDSEDNLKEVVRRLLPKHVIIERLHAAGKLTAARAALDAADLYTRERWNTREVIFADDPTALALLNAIGADTAVIMAEE